MFCEMGSTQGSLRYVSALNTMHLVPWLILIAPLCLWSLNARYIILKSFITVSIKIKWHYNHVCYSLKIRVVIMPNLSSMAAQLSQPVVPPRMTKLASRQILFLSVTENTTMNVLFWFTPSEQFPQLSGHSPTTTSICLVASHHKNWF